MKSFSVRQDSGQNLRQVVSGLLVKSPIEAIKELVSNSYDADATNVKVNIVIPDRTILVEDNGYGMGETDLEKFIQMGDSDKIRNPITPKGRHRIGKFGIANTLLQYLGNYYEIDTWHGRTHISGYEIFGQEATGAINYEVHKNTGKKTGTRIFIRDSRFVGTPKLSFQRLEDALAWEVPNQPDFIVIFNGITVKRENPKPEEVFDFKENLPHAGDVNMKISIYPRSVRINGVYVYVDGRSVGSSDTFNLRNLLRSSPQKFLATVNADGLRDYISFDRSRFLEDNPAFYELKKWVNSNISKITSSMRGERIRNRAITPSRSDISEALKETSYLTKPIPLSQPVQRGRLSGPTKSQLEYTKEHLGKGNGKPRISAESTFNIAGFNTRKNGNHPAHTTLDTRTRELTFNVDHPWYKSSDITSPGVLKMHLLLGTCFGLAEGFYLKQGGSKDYVNRLNALCTRLLGSEDILESVRLRIDANETGRFAPFRDYYFNDLVREGVASIPVSRQLVRAGIFHLKGEKVSGAEINDYITRSVNYTPAMDLVYEWGMPLVRAKKLTRQRIDQLAKRIDETLIHFARVLPFIENIGTKKPFFLVENESAPAFLGLYAKRIIKRLPTDDPVYYERFIRANKKIFDKVLGSVRGSRFVDVETLCDVAKGSPYEVFKVIGFSQRRGIELPFDMQDGRVCYSLTHFKKARQKYLAGGQND